MWEEAAAVLNPGSMILKTIAWGAAAGAMSLITASAIPSLLNKMLPTAAHDEFWTFLPFKRIAEDGKTIICADGRHLRVIELEGAELTLAGEMMHQQLFDNRKHWIDELERFGLDHVKIFTLKEEISLTRSLKAANRVVRAMDDKWEREFPTPTRMTHYIVLIAKGKTLEDTRVPLDSAEAHTMSALGDYHPVVLTEPQVIDPRAFDDDEARPHGPLKPFAHVLSPITRHSPMGMKFKGPLSALLTADGVDFSRVQRGLVQFRSGSERRWSSVMTWRDCGDRTSEAIMSELMSLDHELIIYHAIQPIETTSALLSLNRGKKSAKTMHLSAHAEEAYTEVLRQVEGHAAGERASLIYYAMHIMPICKSEEELERAQKDISRIMSRTTGTAVALRAMAQPTYLSMADPAQAWPRKFRFLSDNAAACVYLQRTLRGSLASDWCNEPLAWLRTLSGDPYPLQLHVTSAKEAAAHTLFIGSTGAGKTTLMTFIAAQAMRVPRLRINLFDRLNGMKVFTNCAGGNYIDFEGATSRSIFNPLHLPDSLKNRAFQLRWMQEITSLTDITSRNEFSRMIDLIYGNGRSGGLPKEMRSLKNLANAAFASDGAARQALTPWIEDNQYGRVFNATEETFNLASTNLSAYNMTQVLNDPILAPAVISYLVHRIQELSIVTEDPSLVVVDETAPMLRNKVFADRFLGTGLMEGRKLRQAFVLAFQTPEALMATGMQQVIMDQCQTQVFFRMGRDSENAIEQYAAFGLNPAEMDFIARRTFKRFPYAVLIRKGTGESAMVNADITLLGKMGRMFKSGTESVGRLEKLMGHLPRDQAIKTYLEE